MMRAQRAFSVASLVFVCLSAAWMSAGGGVVPGLLLMVAALLCGLATVAKDAE